MLSKENKSELLFSNPLQQAPHMEGDIFIGQYSIIHQMLELARAGKLKLPANLYALKHFTEKTHEEILEIARWGQKPFETPLSMEHSSVLKEAPQDEYLTLRQVVAIRQAALDELRERGFNVVEVDEILNVSQDHEGQISITYMQGEDATRVKHSKNAVVCNAATKPRRNRKPEYQAFSNNEALYERKPIENDCPKIVFGAGPSAIWVKERCPHTQVYFAAANAVRDLQKFKRNPRNTQVVNSITQHDQLIPEEVFTGTQITQLGDEDWQQEAKRQLALFLEQYPHLESDPSKVAVVIDQGSKEVKVIGEGINAIGYEPDHSFTEHLSPENALSLHIPATEQTQDTVAPQEILGSVMHQLDYQRMLLADLDKKRGKEWSLDEKMTLMVHLERLFLRIQDRPPAQAHAQIIRPFIEQYTGIRLSDEFFRELTEEIRAMGPGPKSYEDSIKLMGETLYRTMGPKPPIEPKEPIKPSFKSIIHDEMEPDVMGHKEYRSPQEKYEWNLAIYHEEMKEYQKNMEKYLEAEKEFSAKAKEFGPLLRKVFETKQEIVAPLPKEKLVLM